MDKQAIAEALSQGNAFLGIEFGSTRIKAVLTDLAHNPVASGAFDWENSLIDGIWTYSLGEVIDGMQQCFADLKRNVRSEYGVTLTGLKAMGISAMMHGYLVFDAADGQLAQFRTWRNTITGEAAAALSARFQFNIPERWSIAHLYQAILNGEEHVKDVAYMTTLAGYIHMLLTGKKVLGVGDASGMFPVDGAGRGYQQAMLDSFDELIADRGFAWKIRDILPEVLYAGESAGVLTQQGAKLLDVDGDLLPGIPLCPPEGDAGTGMTATDSVALHTGNVSAGTSIFAMAVLEHDLAGYYPEIDMVTTPDGKPVAMVHCNNCTGDLDGWIRLFGEAISRFGVEYQKYELYDRLLLAALDADADCGGLINFNYLSGESITGLASGKPLFLRTQNSRFNLPNFMKAQLLSCLATLRIGMDILYREGVTLDSIAGHGGFFKTKQTGCRYMAAALNTPVKVMQTAGEGGPWGIAVLAGYMANKADGEPLDAYLKNKVFACAETEVTAVDAAEKDGFDAFLRRYQTALAAEKTAAEIEI